MKIGIIAPGMRGDVEPHLALAKQLQSRGHAVTVASHATFAPACDKLGIPFRVLDRTDVKSIATSLMHEAPKKVRGRSLMLLWRMLRTQRTWGDFRDLDTAVEVCRESDVVVCVPGPIPHICENMRKPVSSPASLPTKSPAPSRSPMRRSACTSFRCQAG